MGIKVMDRCWYCTYPNEVKILYNHPRYVIMDRLDALICVPRIHGVIDERYGCVECLIARMKKSLKCMAIKEGIVGEIKESFENEHLRYYIEK